MCIDKSGNRPVHAIQREGNATAQALAKHHEVTRQVPRPLEAPVSKRKIMRFIQAQQAAMPVREVVQAGEKAGVGLDQGAVAERRFGDDNRDFFPSEDFFSRGQIVEGHDFGVQFDPERQTQAIRPYPAAGTFHQGVVEVAVVVAIKNQDLVTLGHRARDTHDFGVRTAG